MGRIIKDSSKIPDVPFYVIYPETRNLRVRIDRINHTDNTGEGEVISSDHPNYEVGYCSDSWALGAKYLLPLYYELIYDAHRSLRVKDLV